VPAQPVGRRRRVVGEHLGELVEDALAVARCPPRDLGLDDVDAPLKQAAEVGQIRLGLLRLGPSAAQVLHRQAGEIGDEALVEYAVATPVTPTPEVGHRRPAEVTATGRRSLMASMDRASSIPIGGRSAIRASPEARATSCALLSTGWPGA